MPSRLIRVISSRQYFLQPPQYFSNCPTKHPATDSLYLLCHPCYKGTTILSYIRLYDVQAWIGSRTYNNGRASFIGAATITQRSSRIRANKVGHASSTRISAKTKLHSVSSRFIRVQDFPLGARTCVRNAARLEEKREFVRRRKSRPQLADTIFPRCCVERRRCRKFISSTKGEIRTRPTDPRKIYTNATNDFVGNCDSGLNESSW